MPEQPNFLIIMADQHAPDAIAALGHPAVKTPWLDRLVSSGVTFRNAYCAYPMCTPSRASFMTGHMTREHGVWELGTPLRSDMPTWAHVLRKAGYATSISGRMHFVGHDKLHGFEKSVHPDRGAMLMPYTYGCWDHPQTDDHVMVKAITDAGPTENATSVEQYDTAVVDAAVTELSELVAHQDQRPWALMVGLLLPHFPYAISQPYYDMYEDTDIPMPRVPPGDQSYEECVPPQFVDSRKWLGLTTDGATPEQVCAARRCYYGMITSMDELIGKLLTHLEQSGAAENTWVVFLSDHGDNMGEHGFWSKLNFYEDSVRVPLVVARPGDPNAGRACHAPVSLVDWMSTVLDLTGEEAAFEPLPGRSLLPLLDDPTQTWPERPIVADYACDGTRVPMRMVRRGRWKASFAPGHPPVLFDLEDDPHEWNDLSGEAPSQAVLAELRAIACVDGWGEEPLLEEIRAHKRRLTYISTAEKRTQG
ncbi:MAG: sulfatase-like hydrolase/transferase [Lentisphaerae bacterium]|jgi:choline-sulfatase|nr:sulfatase-like hydrolase/transferase [Lentisphaerota bacterium]MBT4821841.1 sulfatase-like hydrolase/transferase [Lentisphaerota bacterium]MBT5605482.1 sulfatase-like hydrolase/transferase [Lentisphaerota bacterium]MBT7060087.1 sulfatase-like hydrolase/transferase [Lentisphaerota bacterium]MBT7840853.1 sulfatase-like hydrolase/transferase [Lentisphaerota bacterium]